MTPHSNRVAKPAYVFNKSVFPPWSFRWAYAIMKTMFCRVHLETRNFSIWKEACEWINSTTKDDGRKHALATGFLYYNQGLIYLRRVNFCNTLCTVWNTEWQLNRAVKKKGKQWEMWTRMNLNNTQNFLRECKIVCDKEFSFKITRSYVSTLSKCISMGVLGGREYLIIPHSISSRIYLAPN